MTSGLLRIYRVRSRVDDEHPLAGPARRGSRFIIGSPVLHFHIRPSCSMLARRSLDPPGHQLMTRRVRGRSDAPLLIRGELIAYRTTG